MTIGNFTVWIVDGEYIRTNIGEEFTNCGQHLEFKFIPKNELWIDRWHEKSNEKDFFIEWMMNISKLTANGISYKKAVEIANAKEKRERRKSAFFRKKLQTKCREEIIKKIHKKLLYKYSNKLHIWLVNGEIVRDILFLDFTEGGHDKVYKFIPKYEVWLDNEVSQKERKFILLHELHERRLMSQGKDYEQAHYASSRIEFHYRHKKKEVWSAIRKELKENEKII